MQPDTIVPEPGNPQALNRYSYVLNNALRYTDPTGHRVEPPHCLMCDLRIDITNWSKLATGLAVAGCAFVGCHVNTEQGVIVGPTEQEYWESAIAGLANPIGMVKAPTANIAKRVVDANPGLRRFQEVGSEVIADLVKVFADEGRTLGAIPSTLTNRRVTTLGRAADTAAAKDLGERILDLPEPHNPLQWSLEVNYEWLQAAIRNGDVFYLASPVNARNLAGGPEFGGLSVLARELDALLRAGYRRICCRQRHRATEPIAQRRPPDRKRIGLQ